MDNKIFDLISAEKQRQRDGLELIPSENYVSQQVLDAMGSVFTNKYCEGYPGFEKLDGSDDDVLSIEPPNHRYYGGQQNTDKVERLAIARARRIFHADHANVQPHSGAQANNAVYNAWLMPGDTVLGMSMKHGGHLTHGSPVTQSAGLYNFISYGTDPSTGDIDYNELARLALQYQPKIILVGYSAFSKIPDFEKIAKIGQQLMDCMLMADMAHVAGLIAGGAHPNPLDFGFHVMTTTTHKTLRGPRGGLILSRGIVGNPLRAPEHNLKNLPTLIDRSVFPGTQGGPLMHIIAAKAVAFHEAEQLSFQTYARDVVANAKSLSDTLITHGFKVVGGGTENHLILVDMMASFGIDGKTMERMLDKVGLTLNANSTPDDTLPPYSPSGIRLGTAALTTRGMSHAEMVKIGMWMRQVADICVAIRNGQPEEAFVSNLAAIREEVRQIATIFPVPGI